MTATLFLWRDAARTFPGLTQFGLPADPAKRDRYIYVTLASIHRGLECDVSKLVADLFRETGADRARVRRVLRRVIPQLREARRWPVMATELQFLVAAE